MNYKIVKEEITKDEKKTKIIPFYGIFLAIKKHWYIFTIYSPIMTIFIIGSILINLPILLLISIYALTLSSITLFHDNKILNSLTIPFTFMYLLISFQDILDLNLLFFVFHAPTAISCLFVIKRRDHNLYIMLSMSILYALWVYLIKATLYFPFYEFVLGIKGALNQTLILMLICVSTSILASIRKHKN